MTTPDSVTPTQDERVMAALSHVSGAIFIGGFFFIVYGILGAIMAFQGKPFRYLIIGRSVERFMQPKQDIVTNQNIENG